ncbi:MAG: hypothetical protein ABJF04_22350 [Reichenbachiella sp.]|uniref:hypothetical protein n=1 Tax=Reichenbachiella sp. TaxID=2184521 RepID=UPI0032669DC7
MPVKSYLVFPKEGEKNNLVDKLNQLDWCEVLPAQNKDVLVLVTDTLDESDEDNCLNQLNEIQEIKHYTLVSGFEENENHTSQ